MAIDSRIAFVGHSHESDRDFMEQQDSTHINVAGSCSPLESLPAELRDQILLSMPDLPSLRSIVHASPVMHAQYRSNRDSLLRACLERELDGFFVHAYACAMSRVGKVGKVRTDEAITGFLDGYRRWLPASPAAGPSLPIDPTKVHRSYIRWMAAFQLRVARPLTRMYSIWALTNLVQSAASSSPEEQAAATAAAGGQDASTCTPSRSEEVRIMRAIYQCETYYHLFGRNEAVRQGSFCHFEINDIFFSLFDPWEAEAVGCIDMFVRQRYDLIFDKVQADLHRVNPKFKQKIDPVERKDYMEGTVSRGLKLAVRNLEVDNTGDPDALIAKMARCLTHEQRFDYSIEWSLSQVAQRDRRELLADKRSARDEAEERGDPIEFTGDGAPGPPFAWVLLWRGVYSNICGEYVPLSVRQWGYVMWDERRWNGLSGLVSKQWDAVPHLVFQIEQDLGWRR